MKKRTLSILLVLVLAAALLCSCGSRSSGGGSYKSADQYYEADYYYDDYDFAPAAAEEAYWSGAAAPMPATEPGAAVSTSLSASVPNTVDASRESGAKLIYTADLTMETMEFDEAVSGISRLTAECGGYYESSSVSESGSTRSASYTVRVPAQNYRMFLDQVGQLCHMLSQQEYTEDVSEAYYDTSGRLETQKTKLSRLQALLAQAENMEDIITIEDAISETEEMIDRLSGTLRRYDALVDYSTVDIYLREVKVYEPEPDPTYGVRLGSAFTEGLADFAAGIGDIIVALAYIWLWLVLIAVIVIVILWLTRKRRAEKKTERAERKARREAARLNPAPAQYSQPSDTPKDDAK